MPTSPWHAPLFSAASQRRDARRRSGTKADAPAKGCQAPVITPSLGRRAHPQPRDTPSHLTSFPAFSSSFPGSPFPLFDLFAARFKSNPLRLEEKPLQ